MKRTNTEDFRSNLKDWMDEAMKAPIKITRRSGESFILAKSEEFESLQMEIASLRGLARGLSDALNGRVYDSRDRNRDKIIEKVKTKYSKKKSTG